MTCLATAQERQRIRKLHDEMQEQLQFGIEDYNDEMERESLEGI